MPPYPLYDACRRTRLGAPRRPQFLFCENNFCREYPVQVVQRHRMRPRPLGGRVGARGAPFFRNEDFFRAFCLVTFKSGFFSGGCPHYASPALLWVPVSLPLSPHPNSACSGNRYGPSLPLKFDAPMCVIRPVRVAASIPTFIARCIEASSMPLMTIS